MNWKWFRSSAVLLILILGCNHEPLPTAPLPTAPPPPPPSSDEVWLRGVVYDNTNRCLPDAVVAMTAGRNAGVEAKNDCRTTHGFYGGYLLTGLRDNDVVTVRAAAAGHVTREAQITIVSDMDGLHMRDFYLEKE